jgi:hypothetical protein
MNALLITGTDGLIGYEADLKNQNHEGFARAFQLMQLYWGRSSRKVNPETNPEESNAPVPSSPR